MTSRARKAARFLDMHQVTCLGSAGALALMVTCGHAVLTEMGSVAQLLEGELDAVAYFLMLFYVVSAVTGRSAQDQ